MKEKTVLTVTQLNTILKTLIEEAFREIYVEGEISNLKQYVSGHMFFSLKDATSQIQCIMFRENVARLKFQLSNGLKCICYGRIDLYIPRGEHRFIVYEITPQGLGALQLAFEQLKKKLEKEGLFAQERKKKIPLLPQRIGIVTSPSGAAIRDILTVIRRRFANVEILLYPVKVQGEGAAEEISEGIKFLNEHFPYLDVILVGRGGGSIEDLWAFNEEIVARAIANSKIPIISCVGHEIDYTIADFVADLRAPTPSAAAELVVKNKEELVQKLNRYKKFLYQYLKQKVDLYIYRFNKLSSSKIFVQPKIYFEEKLQQIVEIEKKLILHLKHFIEIKFHKLNLLKEKLLLLSPENILSRGYAMVWYNNKILKDTKILSLGDEVLVKLCKGEFVSIVKEIK